MISRSTGVGAASRSRQRGFLLNPYRFGAPPSTDPYFSNVSLLLHMNGANGSSTFTDNSPSPKTMTSTGAVISTGAYKFGGASGLFDGIDDFVSTPDHADFTLGTSDFTIELFVNLNSVVAQTRTLMGQLGSAGTNTTMSFGIQKRNDNRFVALCSSGGSVIGEVPTISVMTAGVWRHLAYTRNGSTFTLWLDGVSQGTATSASAVNDSSDTLSIGRFGAFNGQYAIAYLDEVRITKGVARYTTGFTPPSAQFPDS